MENWTLTKWIVFVIAILILFSVVFFAINSASLLGGTVVKRKVFENSFQYQQGAKEQINIMEAELAKIDAQLANPNIDETTKSNLLAQRASIEVRLQAAKEKVK